MTIRQAHTNGERWRILTPAILCVLTMMATWNQFTMSRLYQLNEKIEKKVENLEEKLIVHITDPKIHYALRTELDLIRERMKESLNPYQR